MVFSTITSENDWVCEDDYKPTMIQTVFWVGNTIGCFLWGFTNDFLGRKPTVLLAHLVYFLGGLATIFIQNFNFLLFARFLVGCAHHTVSHLPFLIGKKPSHGCSIFNASKKIFYGQLLSTVE